MDDMDDDDLAEFKRLAEIAARHSSRHLELLQEWLADPLRDPAKLRRADAEARLLDLAMADLEAFVEQRVLRPGLP